MLTVALLGTGNIARDGHLPAYLSSPVLRQRVRIVALADPCPANRAAAAALLPDARVYADAETLLAAETPDFVDICAPPYAHRPLIELALYAGCHVLCEKPLATDLADALAIRALAERTGAIVFPCHQYHYAPQWQATRDAILSGAIGTVLAAALTVQRCGANRGAPAWRPAWRTEPELAGGGILVDHGTHLFYQLSAIFGPPLALSCRTERRLPDVRAEDTATVYLRYPRGLARLYLTWAASHRATMHRYAGTRGVVACLDNRIVITAGGEERTISFAEGLSTGSAHSAWFGPLLEAFVERIATNDRRRDLLDEAVRVAAFLTRAYESAARGGRALRWRDPLALPLHAGAAAG